MHSHFKLFALFVVVHASIPFAFAKDLETPNIEAKKDKGRCSFGVKVGAVRRDGLSIDELRYLGKQPGGAYLLKQIDPNLDEEGINVLALSNQQSGTRLPLIGAGKKECDAMDSAAKVFKKRADEDKSWKYAVEDEMSAGLSPKTSADLNDWIEYGKNKGSDQQSSSRSPASVSK